MRAGGCERRVHGSWDYTQRLTCVPYFDRLVIGARDDLRRIGTYTEFLTRNHSAMRSQDRVQTEEKACSQANVPISDVISEIF